MASGKSIIYLLPAVERDDLILVVSPLCSLILDQVGQLNSNTAGHRVGYNLSSSAETSREDEDAFSLDEFDWTVDECDPTAPPPQHSSWRRIATASTSACVQRSRVLFCTPENLVCENFRQKLHNLHRRRRFAYFVVDECHLLIDQGYSFRQDYLKVGWLRTAFAQTQILCFSATCGAYVTTSLTSLLSLRAVHIFQMDSVKRNVHFSVHYVSKQGQTVRVWPQKLHLDHTVYRDRQEHSQGG